MSPWVYRLALLTAGMTSLLILAGGVVTGTGSGLAVPDWPTTFGYNMFTFPLSGMVGGILYEHSHRLIGSMVGMLTVILCITLWFVEPRQWVRWLGVVALVGVILQGVLGGLRVVLLQDRLELIHGAAAYAFFALVASLAVFTSPGWRGDRKAGKREAVLSMQRLGLLTTIGLYVQILIGTILTHTGTRLDAHLFFAAVVSGLVLLLSTRILRTQSTWPWLAWPAKTLLWLLVLQLLLGLGLYVGRFAGPVNLSLGLAFSVGHRLTGGLMLVASLVLTLRAYRLAGTTAQLAHPESASRQVTA